VTILHPFHPRFRRTAASDTAPAALTGAPRRAAIHDWSADLLRVEQGSLYPALHRMELEGWLAATRGTTEKNRQARFYAITRAGRRQLAREQESWARLTAGVHRVLRYT
jgi:DNA-binding PadR family transcriptional regulator